MRDGLYREDPISCDICGGVKKHDDTCPPRSLGVKRIRPARIKRHLTREEEALRETVKAWARVSSELEDLQRRQYNLEQAIDSQCELLNVREREIENVKVLRKPRITWLQDQLRPLHELLPQEGYSIEDFLTPQKPAPERKFNMTYVKKLQAHGGEISKVIDSAKHEESRVKLTKLVGGTDDNKK